MPEMITLADEPNTAPFLYGTRPYHRVQPFVSMNEPEPQPQPRYYSSFANAVADALEHTFSEPWRTHAQVWSFFPDAPVRVGMIWVERDSESGRAIIGERHGMLTPEMEDTLNARGLFWSDFDE